MRLQRQRENAARSGMTIVEILVALIVFGVVGAMTLHFVVSTGRTSKKQTSRIVRESEARTAMELLCRDLQNLPAPNLVGGVGIVGNNKDIEGNGADSIQFITAGFLENDQVAFSEVFYGIDLVQSEDTKYTVLKRRQDDTVDGQVGGSDNTLSGIPNYRVKLDFQYRGNRNLKNEAGWKDQWGANDPLPKAIRIELEIEDTTANLKDAFQKVKLVRVVSPKAALPF